MQELATPSERRPSIDREDVPAVLTRGLTKIYRHPWTMKVTRGIEDLDLEVRRGEVFGYLGPNGAGKTTTLKLLTGLHKPTRGEASIFGVPVAGIESRQRLGFLPEQPYFYDYLTGLEYLEMTARLSGLGAHEARRRAAHWLGRVGLGGSERRVLRKYSKGMLQRAGLAAALVHEPDLLILDEPMSGLDPLGRRDVRDLILEQRERGVTVVFSSHILPDVEMLCDRVAILMAGRLARTVTVHELIRGGSVAVEVTCEGHPLIEIPASWNGIVTRTERTNDTVLRLVDERALPDVLGVLLRQNVGIQSVLKQRVNLEDLYVATAGAAEPRTAQRRPA